MKKSSGVFTAFCLLILSSQSFAQDSLAVALYQKGHALLQHRDYPRALTFLQDATTQDPNLVKAWIDLGRCRICSGQPQSAIEALKRASEMQTDSAETHYYLGEAYSMLSQYPEAINEYKQSVKIQPKLTDAYFSLGIAYIAIGNRTAAQKELLHLQVMDTNDNEALTHMGNGYLKSQYLWILQFLNQPGHKYPPINEAAKDSSFEAFRNRLIKAVKEKDSKYVMSNVVNANTALDIGEMEKNSFVKEWKINSPQSPFWPAMDRILSIGGGWVQGYEKNTTTFLILYTFKKFPYKTDETKTYGIVTKPEATLRAAPSMTSPALKSLSYDVVIPLFEESVGNEQGGDYVWQWTRVITAKGDVGYLSAEELYADNGLFAEFAKIKGHWVMTDFRPDAD